MAQLILPEGIPAQEILRTEGVPVSAHAAAGTCPLRVLFLNLMPQKAVTELDIARMMAASGLDVELIPLKISGQTYKTTPMAHMEAFYRDFETVEADSFDGLIITGAPVEHLAFEEVRYWPQLCHIMNWADVHVRSTLYICWGAQAGLYFHYGIPKYGLPAKKFGIYPHENLAPSLPLLEGLGENFPIPTSRHTEVRAADFNAPDLRIVAESDESGVGIALTTDGRRIFITGHLEYEPATLEKEYLRDKAKQLPIEVPGHYYYDNLPERGIRFSWDAAARRFYHNWLRYYAAGEKN